MHASRFTPTGVGTTVNVVPSKSAASVHPHGRGDNIFQRCAVRLHRGSPPRAWGQRPQRASTRGCRRFTPTGVGTTDLRDARPYRGPVHPHGRGDNISILLILVGAGGSPPRAWGQLRVSCASNLSSPVHPHGRGDNAKVTFSPQIAHGSPPRAWGQPTTMEYGWPLLTVHPHGRGDNVSKRAQNCVALRFTPTGVGTTSGFSTSINARRGSPPRAWGQLTVGLTAVFKEAGSPPRAWGQLSVPVALASSRRFTPTGVGTTHFSARALRPTCGSPPRAWGQRIAQALHGFPSAVHPHGRGDN